MSNNMKNPFEMDNANFMSVEEIGKLWLNPFEYFVSSVSESIIKSDMTPSIFVGSRGSGKTMMFKYYSYYVQKVLLKKERKRIIETFKLEDSFLAIYIRFEDYELKLFEDESGNFDQRLFTHFFELYIANKYIDILDDLFKEGELQISNDFYKKICKMLGIKYVVSINDLGEKLREKLDYVFTYLDMKRLSIKSEFKEIKLFRLKELSFGLIDTIWELIPDLNKVKFALFIDEYENFFEPQQKTINQMVKFSNCGIESKVTIKIGTRSSRLKTIATISDEELLKEGRDYREVKMNSFVVSNAERRKHKEFFSNIANLRLKHLDDISENSILALLGKSEDFEKEALDTIQGKDATHFNLLNQQDSNIINYLSYPPNPLYEMMNILLFNRNKLKLEEIKLAMEGYINKAYKNGDKLAIKYKNDYSNKYKLTLLFLLLSHYKSKKKFYSFDTIYKLSSGIPSIYLRLCYKIFQRALFTDRKELLQNGRIASTIQDSAIHEIASIELDHALKVDVRLYYLVNNIGNIFKKLTKDKNARYPETNQFVLNINNPEYIKLVDLALRESIILEKPNIQQEKIGGRKSRIFVLNRIFSPLYDISYRTRGGYSEVFDDDAFSSLISNCDFETIIKKTHKLNEVDRFPLLEGYIHE